MSRIVVLSAAHKERYEDKEDAGEGDNIGFTSPHRVSELGVRAEDRVRCVLILQTDDALSTGYMYM